MNKNLRFETLVALTMLILSATISIIAVSLEITIVSYFFSCLGLLFAAIITANIYEEN